MVDYVSQGLPTVWVHAVSVGEVNAAKPIIKQLLQEYPEHQIIITTVTPTGAEVVKQDFAENLRHYYLPYDLPFFISAFLHRCRPDIVIILETEIWPNLCHLSHKRSIPVLLVNARLSEKSANRYRLVSALTLETLKNITLIAAQTESDRKRFIELGANEADVKVMGNLKFDVQISDSALATAELAKQYFSGRTSIWIAASTHAGEEEIILEAHRLVMEQFPDSLLILAPRHPDRAQQLRALCDDKNLYVIRKTDELDFNESLNVFILDTLGELYAYYAAANLAFVGGSLVDRGGQNMLEPASLGLPVIVGPYTYNFTAISNMLHNCNAAVTVNSANELASTVCSAFADKTKTEASGKQAKITITNNRGSVDNLMALLRPFLEHIATNQKKVI